MSLTLEAVAATICVLALVGLAWWGMGRILHPLPELPAYVLLMGRGDGEGLEQTLREFMWLRGMGLLNAPILIADVDLTARGYALAWELTQRWPGVTLWPAESWHT